MKLQILPNWCKKLGLAIFIIFSFSSVLRGWEDGMNASCNNGLPVVKTIEVTTPYTDYFGENMLHWFDVLSIFGILIYMLSKEKIEDDYINQLRLESYQLTAIIGIVISILLYAFAESIQLTPDYFITLFMYFYLITFFIKKRVY